MTAARELGYEPAGDYAATVADEVEWLVALAATGDRDPAWGRLDTEFFTPLLDYDAEDRYLAAHPDAAQPDAEHPRR